MKSDVIVQQKGGIGFLGLLAICFIVLKLCGVITWSWWLVTAPLWGPFVIVFGSIGVFIAGVFLVAGISSLFKGKLK